MKYGELNLGQIEAIVNKLGGMEGVQRFLSGELVTKAAELLKKVTTFTTKATARFSVRDTFGAKKPAIKLWYLSDNFTNNFLNKVEEQVPAATLAVHTLTKASRDAAILAELGDKAETTLSELWQMLKAQANGQSGPLLTNGYWNVFYIKDAGGTLWAVDVDWDTDYGWVVYAASVDYPHAWHAGCQVVSRDSVSATV